MTKTPTVQDQQTETIELTHILFQTLLNLTGGDPGLLGPARRALAERLHAAQYRGGVSRWMVELTAEDLETIRFLLGTCYLSNPGNWTRFTNILTQQSPVYRELVERAKDN